MPREALKDLKLDDEDANTGVAIVRRALEEPMRRIAENAGQDGAVVIDSVRRVQAEKKSKNIGYDVITGEYVDMVKAGIIDPAKVTGRAGERRLHRRHDPDHRSAGHRRAREGQGGPPRRRCRTTKPAPAF